MARELLRYLPVDDLYEEWLEQIAELVSMRTGAPPSRLARCLSNHLQWATWRTGLLHHLRPRAPSSSQGVWLRGATRHALHQLWMT